MKKTITIVILCFINILVSCKKDNPVTAVPVSSAAINAIVTSGTWRVTSFVEDGRDDTGSFNGFQFVFNRNGSVTAARAGGTVTGAWQSLTDSGKTKLVIDFKSPSSFENISEDWEVVELSNSRARLRHVSGGDGSTDILVLEKI